MLETAFEIRAKRWKKNHNLYTQLKLFMYNGLKSQTAVHDDDSFFRSLAPDSCALLLLVCLMILIHFTSVSFAHIRSDILVSRVYWMPFASNNSAVTAAASKSE